MSDKALRRITNQGEVAARVEIDGLGFFDQGVPRDVEVTEDQARCLAGKGFTVEDPAPAKSREE